MSELPITEKDYDRSIRIVLFNGEVKRIAESNEQISDIHFIPVIKGYEITYSNNGIPEKLCVNAKSRFFNGLIIKRYVDGGLKGTYRSKSKENNTEILNKIFNMK